MTDNAQTFRRPRVSVALTTYNGMRYLREQFQSIAAQSVQPDEIIVGDDQSTDGTVAWIEAFARTHPALGISVIVNAERLGSTRNFESVVRRCAGDVILFSDQDDEWLPDRVAVTLAAFDANPDAGLVFADAGLINEKGGALKMSLFASAEFSATERTTFCNGHGWDVVMRRNVCTGATMAIRRREVDALLPFQDGMVHDYFIVLMMAFANRAVVIDHPVIRYRVHANQQIGVVRGGLHNLQRLWMLVRMQSVAFLLQNAQVFDCLKSRIALSSGGSRTRQLTLLDGKVEFLRARARMRERRWLAPSIIMRAAYSGHYKTFGLGWKTMVVDIVACALLPLKGC